MEPALELNHTLDRFRLLFEGTVDYAVFHLGFDGLIETWNPGAERIFGFTSTEIVGKHGSVLWTPEDNLQGIPER
ncbi:MAG TPA: PAS domain S-box protein, partial [Gemmatimonadales bacterium]|nr:PAS domain S-box protein [Gemmatimonadales bacterium]